MTVRNAYRFAAVVLTTLMTVGLSANGAEASEDYRTGCSDPYNGLVFCSEAPHLLAAHLGPTKLVRWVEDDRTVQINFRVMAKGNAKWLTGERDPEIELDALHRSNTELWSLTRQDYNKEGLPLEYVGSYPIMFTFMTRNRNGTASNGTSDWLFATANVCGAAIIMEQFHKPNAPLDDMIGWAKRLVKMARPEGGECNQNA